MPTVGESNVPTPSVTLTLLMSHRAEVQSFIVSALLAKYVPNMFWNERSFVVRSSSFAASFVFQASQTLFSIAIIAAVLGSAAGFVGALSFVGFSWLPAFAGGRFLGSKIRFWPWNTARHVSPVRTQTVAARIGLGTFIDFPSGAVQLPSNVPL